MFIWRNAIILGGGFVVVGVLYLLLQGDETLPWLDRAGATLLILLGVAMAFTFAVLLRGSREL
jgi:hypothetical protein